jgi:hypothetical protein
MSGHAQKFGGSFPQIFVLKFEKMKVERKTPEFSKKVKISCIYKFLVVGNPQKLVPFLTVTLIELEWPIRRLVSSFLLGLKWPPLRGECQSHRPILTSLLFRGVCGGRHHRTHQKQSDQVFGSFYI